MNRRRGVPAGPGSRVSANGNIFARHNFLVTLAHLAPDRMQALTELADRLPNDGEITTEALFALQGWTTWVGVPYPDPFWVSYVCQHLAWWRLGHVAKGTWTMVGSIAPNRRPDISWEPELESEEVFRARVEKYIIATKRDPATRPTPNFTADDYAALVYEHVMGKTIDEILMLLSGGGDEAVDEATIRRHNSALAVELRLTLKRRPGRRKKSGK
jgi:hypothetical protein